MRSIRVDIVGTTDSKGNFSQTIRLDKTDEWRNLKVAIGTTAAAEWALTTAGTPLTYGRGRRVTLGPELLQPFDTLTVSCTGGPVSAAVSGSCTGTGGSEQEIVSAYVPAPNTIALDSAAPIVKLGNVRVTANQTLSTSFPLPPGALAIGFLVDSFGSVGSPTQVQVSGDQTLDTYLTDFNPTGLHGAMLGGVDTSATLQVIGNGVTASNVYLVVWTSQAVVALSPFIEQSPLPWQAPQNVAAIAATSVNSAATLNIIPAAAGKTVRLFSYSFSQDAANAAAQWQLQDTTGTLIAAYLDVAARHVFASGDFHSLPLTPGVGLQIENAGAAASFVAGFVTYSQT